MLKKQMVRYIVQKYITCPVTGDVLDERTCIVVFDHEGFPLTVWSPAVGDILKKDPELVALIQERGHTIYNGPETPEMAI